MIAGPENLHMIRVAIFTWHSKEAREKWSRPVLRAHYVPVNQFSSDRSLEETGTSVARQYSIVFAGAGVAAHDAYQARRTLFRRNAPRWWRSPRRLDQGLGCGQAKRQRTIRIRWVAVHTSWRRSQICVCIN